MPFYPKLPALLLNNQNENSQNLILKYAHSLFSCLKCWIVFASVIFLMLCGGCTMAQVRTATILLFSTFKMPLAWPSVCKVYIEMDK